jgi:cytochrome c biogenesis protein CcmG, thiol:disulfide interchange protein DsbE
MRFVPYLFIVSLFFLLAMGSNPSTGGSKDTVSPHDADKIISVKAPDFILRDMQGKDIALSSLKGKVVLLNFWATWCPPCKAEMPAMNKLYNEIKARGFEVVAVSTDNSLSTIRDYLAKNRVDFPILHDEKKSVSKQYRVFSMPTTFLIDRNGTIVEKFYGEYDWTDSDVRKQIEKLL